MHHFAGKLAVVTGGGTGMGRELARQLSAEGCHVAMCDVSATSMADTQALCEADDAGRHRRLDVRRRRLRRGPAGRLPRPRRRRPTHTDHIDLLFNNAGIGGGGSFVDDDRDEWEQVFGVCWGGVYLGTRTFLPMLLASEAGHVVNTSSVNGFWATLGGNAAHRLQRGEVRREGLHRGADHRLPRQRPAPAGVGRDARAHRHVDRLQLRRVLRPRPEGAHRRPGRRPARALRAPRAST